MSLPSLGPGAKRVAKDCLCAFGLIVLEPSLCHSGNCEQTYAEGPTRESLTVKIGRTDQKQAKVEQGQADKGCTIYSCGGLAMDKLLVWGTIALALFALIQVFIMRDFNRRSLRAYVCVSECYLTEGDQPSGIVQIQNFGQTPASQVRHWIGIAIDTIPVRGELEQPEQSQGSISVMPPKVPLTLPVRLKIPLKPNDRQIFGSRGCTAYVYGKVIYEDVYGREWTTGFRFFWDGKTASKQAGTAMVSIRLLRPDTTGNEIS
jgi:hypothetical protein